MKEFQEVNLSGSVSETCDHCILYKYVQDFDREYAIDFVGVIRNQKEQRRSYNNFTISSTYNTSIKKNYGTRWWMQYHAGQPGLQQASQWRYSLYRKQGACTGSHPLRTDIHNIMGNA